MQFAFRRGNDASKAGVGDSQFKAKTGGFQTGYGPVSEAGGNTFPGNCG